MSTPVVKQGRAKTGQDKAIVAPSSPCPRGCNSGPNTAVHLLSDHVEEKARQCTKCNCVAQDVF